MGLKTKDRTMATEKALQLSSDEQATLGRLENVIDAGKESFFKVGQALAEIRERKLYRDGFKTFEVYCRERHGFGRQRASALITAATVVEDIGKVSEISDNNTP